VGTLDARLRRRMLTGYLALLSFMYTLAVLQSYVIDTPRTDGRGEVLAVGLCMLGLLCCKPADPRPWQYVTALTCGCTAPSAALLFHQQLTAQVWSVVPLVCAAVFVRTWHRPAVARTGAVAIWLVAVVALVAAPAAVPALWLILFGATILGAAEVLGMANSALLNAALRDPLTSVWNRAGVDGQAKRVLAQARRRTESVAVIVLDFDDFKTLNDRDGHAAGDVALGDFTHLVRRRLPKSAVFGRLGGDEFVVILSGCDEPAARELAAGLVAGHLVDVSYGVAADHPSTESLAELFDAADADLYQRKRSRKNQTGQISRR
jgi:diguanylate cyclase (GGDEF)-like protein